MQVHPEMESLTQYYAFLPQTYARMMRQPKFKSQLRQFQQKTRKTAAATTTASNQTKRRTTVATTNKNTNNSSFSIRMNKPPRTSV